MTFGRAAWLVIFILSLSLSSYAQKYDWGKLDGQGAHGWNNTWWGGGSQDMVADEYGNLYSIGSILGTHAWGGQGYLDFGDSVFGQAPQGEYTTPYISKYNRHGKAQWATTISSGTQQYLYTTSVAIDSGGNSYIIGTTWWNSVTNIAGYNVNSYGQGDIWLVKVNKNGVIQWAKTFGGNLQDYPTGITCSPKGDVYITGLFQGYFQFGISGISGSSNGWSVFLMKLDTDGEPYYARRIATTTGQNAWQSAGGDVVCDRSENVYVSGAFNGNILAGASYISAGSTGMDDQNGFVMKVLPSTGTPMWVRQMGGSASALAVDYNGDLYVGGKMQTGADSFHTTRMQNAGGIGFDDLYVARMTPTGQLTWVKRFGDNTATNMNPGCGWWCSQRINIASMDVDHAGKIFVSGTIDRTVDTGSICSFSVPKFKVWQWSWSNWSTDAFLLKLTPNGQCEWNARSGMRDTANQTTWSWWDETTTGGGVVTDNAGATYWKATRSSWNWQNNQTDTGMLFFNNDTINSAAMLTGLTFSTPMLWAIREQWVEIDSFSPKVICPGDSITVYYTKHDPFGSGNEFSIKLSNLTGNFFNAIEIGKVTDTGSGVIHGLVPLQTVKGSGYLLRVDGSIPSVHGYPFETPLIVRGRPNTNAGPDDSLCYGDTFNLHGTGGINFRWFNDPFLLDSSVQNPEAFPDTTRNFILRSVDPLTSCYYLDTVKLRVIPHAELVPRLDTTMCQGDSLWIYAAGIKGKPAKYSFVWTDMVTNTVLGEGDSFYVHPRVTTPYRVVLYDSCSIKRDTAIVTVNVRGHVRGNPRQDTTVCIGESLNIYAQPTGGLATAYNYKWYMGDTNLISTDSSFTWPSMDTTATFKLVTDDGGCSDEGDTAYFKGMRRETIELFTRSDTTICNGQSIWLTAYGTGGHPGGYTFTWDNGLPQNDSNNVTPVSSSTTYRVIMADGCTNTEDTGFITIKLRYPLSLIVRPDTLICRGEPLLLHVDGTGGDSLHYTFIWENVGIGNDLTVIPTMDTTYKVRLTDNCTLLSTEDSVHVSLRAPLNITTTPDTTICQENTAQLYAWGTGGYSPTYQFVWSDGITETVLAPGAPYPVTPGTNYTYSVRLQDNCTVISDSSTIDVTLRPYLSVNTIPSDTTICHGAVAQLRAYGTGGVVSAHSYSWENIGVGPTFPVQPLVDSFFRVIMSDGCSPWDTAYVQVRIAMPLSVDGTGDTLVCPEKRVYIEANGVGGVSSAHVYTWSHGLGTGQVKQVSPGVDMAYVITLSDNCSFPAYDTVYVTMAALPDTDLTTDRIEGCQPLLVDFQSGHTDAGGFSNWHWRLEQKLQVNTQVNETKHLFEKPGMFPVKLVITSSYGCVDSSEYIDITVHPKPVAIFDFTPESTNILTPTISMLNTSTNSVAFDWEFGDGNSSTDQHPTYTYSDTGHYPVTLYVASDENCLDTLTREYHIQDVYTCFIPSGFTPNGDRHNDKFYVSGTGVKKLKVQIYDRWGALVYESTERNFVWDGTSRESGEPLPIGVYMYRIQVDMENGGREQFKGTISLVR